MPSNREEYFRLLKLENKYLTKSVIVSLLMDANDIEDRMAFYTHFNDEVKNLAKLQQNSERVAYGEPLQYVLGYSFFLGHKVMVTPDVLIPRQETEQLVIETTLYIKKLYNGEEDFVLADVATGSGCIALAMKEQFKGSEVFASDISTSAIEVAKKNFKGKNIQVLHGNLLDPFIEKGIKLDVLMCNPPYIGNEATIDEQTWNYEPHLALLANPKTKFYEEIFKKMPYVMNEIHYLATFEIGEDMDEEITDLVEKYFKEVRYKIGKDMYGKSRFLYIIK
ncbi:MAG: peptide chain release factor N(5)-glutamine methyltransferase [Bacilli bacterium]|nr:peptide chain release factor N(5)-glutamine methyltransferase [Bacilli bacterium]